MIFEQCKVGHYFVWAGINPGINSPVTVMAHKNMRDNCGTLYTEK